jgi:hypothetical protein
MWYSKVTFAVVGKSCKNTGKLVVVVTEKTKAAQ